MDEPRAHIPAVTPPQRRAFLGLAIAAGVLLPGIAAAAAPPAMPAWTRVYAGSDSMPGRGQHGLTVTPNGDLFVFGGSHWVTKMKTHTYELLGDFWHCPFGGRFTDLTVATACPIPPTIEPHLASDAAGRVYEFGGIQVDLSGVFSQQLYRYDPATRTWRDLTPAGSPAGREDHGFVGDWKRDQLWLFGGVDARAVQLGDLWRFDVAGEAWHVVAPRAGEPRPEARELYDIAWDGDDALYLFGGYSDASGYLHDFWRYDIPDNRWTDLTAASGAAAITPRSYNGLALDANGVLWMAGGYDSPYALGGFWRYDTRAGGRWTDLSALAPAQFLPRATYELVCNPRDQALYAVGGLITTSPESQIHLSDMWRFETRPTVVAQMPETGIPLVRGASQSFEIAVQSASGHQLRYRWWVDERAFPSRGPSVTIGPFCSGKHTVIADVIDGAMRDTTCWSFLVTGSEEPTDRVLDLIAQRDSGGVVLRWTEGGDGQAEAFRVYVKAEWDSTWTLAHEISALEGPTDPRGRCESVATVDSLLAGGTYSFRVVAVVDGHETPGAEREVEIHDIPGDVDPLEVQVAPSIVRAGGNLLVRQRVPGPIRAQLVSVGGRMIRQLYDGPPTGRMTVVPVGAGIAPGVYFLRVTTPAGASVRRLVIAG